MNSARKAIIRELLSYPEAMNVRTYIRQDWTTLNMMLECARNKNMTEATYLWFDQLSGEGMILLNGEAIYVEFHALDYIKDFQNENDKYLVFYSEYPIRHCNMIKESSKVLVNVYENLYMKQIELCVVKHN